MPEGDTVWRTATRLNVALAGEPLRCCNFAGVTSADSKLLPASTVSVTSRGKHLLHRLDNGVTVHSHLRTDGKWRLEATPAVDPSALANPHLRAVAATRTWTALGLHLGAVDIWATSQEDAHLGHLGPDLLGDDWNLEQAVNNLAQPRPDDGTGPGGTGLAAALLDQRNLAGIGPYWASEGLFLNHGPVGLDAKPAAGDDRSGRHHDQTPHAAIDHRGWPQLGAARTRWRRSVRPSRAQLPGLRHRHPVGSPGPRPK